MSRGGVVLLKFEALLRQTIKTSALEDADCAGKLAAPAYSHQLWSASQSRRSVHAFIVHRAAPQQHKIRVNSDNKRRARCAKMALTQSRKVK
jgi:hypothetical protein